MDPSLPRIAQLAPGTADSSPANTYFPLVFRPLIFVSVMMHTAYLYDVAVIPWKLT